MTGARRSLRKKVTATLGGESQREIEERAKFQEQDITYPRYPQGTRLRPMVAHLMLGPLGSAGKEVMPRCNARTLTETVRHNRALEDFSWRAERLSRRARTCVDRDKSRRPRYGY